MEHRNIVYQNLSVEAFSTNISHLNCQKEMSSLFHLLVKMHKTAGNRSIVKRRNWLSFEIHKRLAKYMLKEDVED